MPLIEEIFSDDESACDVKKADTEKLETISTNDTSFNVSFDDTQDDLKEKLVLSSDNTKTDSPLIVELTEERDTAEEDGTKKSVIIQEVNGAYKWNKTKIIQYNIGIICITIVCI